MFLAVTGDFAAGHSQPGNDGRITFQTEKLGWTTIQLLSKIFDVVQYQASSQVSEVLSQFVRPNASAGDSIRRICHMGFTVVPWCPEIVQARSDALSLGAQTSRHPAVLDLGVRGVVSKW